MNIKMAGEYLNNLDVDTVEVFTFPQHKSGGNTIIAVPQLDLFTRKEIVSLQDWSSGKNKNTASLAPLLSTWKLKKPPFYQTDNQPIPLVIISHLPLCVVCLFFICLMSPSRKRMQMHSKRRMLLLKLNMDSGLFPIDRPF